MMIIRILIIAGVAIVGLALVAYLVWMWTMSDEEYEEFTRHWAEGE